MKRPDPVINMSSPAELLTAVPYLVGHQVNESIVVIGLSRDRIVISAVVALDVPTGEAARGISKPVRRAGNVDSLIVIGYSASGDDAAIHGMARALSYLGNAVSIVLRVTGGRYHCLSCDSCTPHDGTPIDRAGRTAASFVLHGFAPLADRGAIDRMVAPITGRRALAMIQAIDRAERRLERAEFSRAEATAAIQHAFTIAQQGLKLADDDAAWLCLVLHDLCTRDIAWQKTDSEQWQFDLWLDLTRRCEPALAAPPATLLAWCAWRRGDGAAANAALDRAFAANPDYRLAHIIARMLAEGMPPNSIGDWPPDEATLAQR